MRPRWTVAIIAAFAGILAGLVAGLVARREAGGDGAAVARGGGVAAGRLVAGLVAMPLLYAAVLWLELPRLGPLWVAPRAEAALRADWPGWNAAGRGLAVVGFAEPSLMFLAGTELRWMSAGEAGAAWAQGRLGAVLVAEPDRGAFEAALAGASARAVVAVDGYNYSRGRRVHLTLFVR